MAEWCREKREYAQHLSGKDQISDEHFIRECCGLSAKNAMDFLFDDFWSGKRDGFFTESYVKESRALKMKKHLNTQDWLLEADRICEGRLCLLGYDVLLAQAGEWHKDPLERCEWPRIFYKYVTNTKPSETVDIKYVWEMNRHQYLVVLGEAYWISGDENTPKRFAK